MVRCRWRNTIPASAVSAVNLPHGDGQQMEATYLEYEGVVCRGCDRCVFVTLVGVILEYLLAMKS